MSQKDKLIYKAYDLKLDTIDALDARSSDELYTLLQDHFSTGKELKQVPCWLAKNVKHLSDEKFAALLDDKAYAEELKRDGNRAKIHMFDDHMRVDSRNRNTTNYHYDEKTANFDFLTQDRPAHCTFKGTIVDAEMVASGALFHKYQSWVSAANALFNSDPKHSLDLQNTYGVPTWHFHDVIFYKGHDVRYLPWTDRMTLLQEVCNYFNQDESNFRIADPFGIHKSPLSASQLFSMGTNGTKNNGVEGIMFKLKDALYPLHHGSRTKTMYKWKKQNEQDCFITGSMPGKGAFDGMIGSLIISCYEAKGIGAQVVGAIQPGDIQLRIDLSHEDGTLKEAYYDKVVEVEYQELTKNKLMRHCTLLRWRPDKIAAECVMI